MSAHRGDEIFDPRPIPDLARPGRIGRAPGDPDLPGFIRALIVEEFDGREPPPAVLDGLVAYVRAIDLRACPVRGDEPVSAEAMADAAGRAVAAARERLGAGDPAGARLMLGAARGALGRIAERYTGLPARIRVETADARLQTILARLDRPGASMELASWQRQSAGWRAVLARDAARSLYDRGVLAARLAQ